MNDCSSNKVICVAKSVERSHVNKRSHLVWEIGLHFRSVTVLYRSCDVPETNRVDKDSFGMDMARTRVSIQSG